MSEDRQDRIDFSSLDPTADRARFDGIVDSVMTAASGELAARRVRNNVVAELGRWKRPLLAAAAITAIVSLAMLARIQPLVDSTEQTSGIAEAIGVPTELAQWIRSEALPSAADVLYGLEVIQ